MFSTTNCGEILDRWEYQTLLPVSWETCRRVKEKQLEPVVWNNWLVQDQERVWQGCLLSPCLFNLYAEHIMRNAGLDELQAGIKIGRRYINNLRYDADTTLMAESEEKLKSFLMRVKEASERASLKLNIKKKKKLRP